MSRHCILILDDEPESVRLLRFAFERAGFVALVADTTHNALQQAREASPDVVLLSLELGHKSGTSDDGLTACRLLRAEAQTAHLPIVLLTAKLRSESGTVEGFKAGADDYVMKPFRPSEVVARVTALLERTKRHDDLSPLTHLPGRSTIQKQLARLVNEAEPLGALFIDLDGFAAYNQTYGLERGDAVLRDLARCIVDAKSRLCAADFAGHNSGDAFVVVTSPEKLEPLAHEIIASVQQVAAAWYPPREPEMQYSMLTLSLAGVTNEVRRFRNALEVAAVGAETMRAIKDKPGSNYLKDRRSSRLPKL